MYNIQNLYGSIAGINNKIFELENQILQHKSPPPQASNQTDMENKIAQLIDTVDALKKNHALFETQLGELKTAITSKQEAPKVEAPKVEASHVVGETPQVVSASISLAHEVTESKQDIASISLAHEVTEAPPQVADDVFELVPPKPKGGRKKKA